MPPILEKCTRVVDSEEQIEARELYWEAISKKGIELEEAEELLVKSIERNRFVGEPHVVVAQLYLSEGRFEEAEREVGTGMRMILEWGSPWDKRTSWEGRLDRWPNSPPPLVRKRWLRKEEDGGGREEEEGSKFSVSSDWFGLIRLGSLVG
ncbi:hypothetical protein LINPERHAP2_LOCUS3225 [Linum perenne]